MKIYIENYGCSANYNNGEMMAGLLKNAGHKLVSEKDADIIIINTCTVKQPTEAKILKRIKKLSNAGKNLIIAGCMPEVQSSEIRKINKDIKLIGLGITAIPEAVKNIGQKKEFKTSGEMKSEMKIMLPKISRNPVISIVQISEGCNNNCAYCIVRLVKGKLVSYPANKIVEEVKRSVSEGAKEIWITSQDNAAYEHDLVKLLKKIVAIEGNFMVRIGMMNPQHVLPILDELIEIYKHEKVFKFLHIPVQSGNNRVLRAMNRKYTTEQFSKIVDRFRQEIPELIVGTDIICGFPTETKNEFHDSIELVEETLPEVINVSRFGSRPGTAAAKMKQIHGQETKKRSQEIMKLFAKLNLETYRKLIGKQYEILIDEPGKRKGQFICRNNSYIPVVVSGKFKLGQRIKVRITDATIHYLVGEKNS